MGEAKLFHSEKFFLGRLIYVCICSWDGRIEKHIACYAPRFWTNARTTIGKPRWNNPTIIDEKINFEKPHHSDRLIRFALIVHHRLFRSTVVLAARITRKEVHTNCVTITPSRRTQERNLCIFLIS